MRINQRVGSVAVEFILVLPGFLFVIFFALEMGLMWVDRHMMRLAAFEAARIYSMASHVNPCDLTQKSAEITRFRNAAMRSAVLKMATISPTIGTFLPSSLRPAFQKLEANTSSNSFLVGTLAEVLMRIPTAYALTEITCRMDEGSVRVDLTYLRSPRFPLVRTAMWLFYVLKQMGLKDAFSLGKYYSGVTFAGQILPGSPEAASVRRLAELNIAKVVAADSTIVRDLINSFGISSPDLTFLNEVAATLNTATNVIAPNLSNASHYLDALIFAMPDQLRLIPMHTSVRLAKATYINQGKDWIDAKAFLVAPFTKGSDSAKNWRAWAQDLSQVKPEF